MRQATPQVLIENREVRVTRWTLDTSEETGLHRHGHNYAVVPLADGVMRVAAVDGSVTAHRLVKGVPYYREAGAEHNVGNGGEGPLDFVELELLREEPGPAVEGAPRP